ncbi:MAG: hypothetical protein RLZZ381_3607, partial [Cyanobacteriota bacterium]
MNRRTFLNWLGLGCLITVSPTIIALIMVNMKDSLATNRKSSAIVFYVSPDGNDAWTGKQPTAQAGDGAFATIARARDAIRELKQQQGGIKQPVTVFLRGGTYFLSETLSFTAEDSGGKDSLITYKAYQQEQPVISGGRIIKGWQEVTLNDRTVWTTNIAEVKAKQWS